MTAQFAIDTIKILIGGRTMVSQAYVTREPGSSSWEVCARLRNADGVGVREVMLMSTEDVNLAVEVKRMLNL